MSAYLLLDVVQNRDMRLKKKRFSLRFVRQTEYLRRSFRPTQDSGGTTRGRKVERCELRGSTVVGAIRRSGR
ncbi:MAG: hypothetical protein ACK4Z8_15645, partial [Novosphingobium sp.]